MRSWSIEGCASSSKSSIRHEVGKFTNRSRPASLGPFFSLVRCRNRQRGKGLHPVGEPSEGENFSEQVWAVTGRRSTPYPQEISVSVVTTSVPSAESRGGTTWTQL